MAPPYRVAVPPSRTKPAAATRRNGTRGPANTEALLAAAHRLVAERGENFTTQDLIKEADVALQTFYRHFGGKDQILLAVVGDLVEAHCNRLAEQAERFDDPIERLRFIVMGTLDALGTQGVAGARFITSQHFRLHQEFPDELAIATKPFADVVQRQLEAGRDAGVLHPRDPEVDAWIINKLVMSVFHHYAFAEITVDIADEVWAFLLAAVGGARPT